VDRNCARLTSEPNDASRWRSLAESAISHCCRIAGWSAASSSKKTRGASTTIEVAALLGFRVGTTKRHTGHHITCAAFEARRVLVFDFLVVAHEIHDGIRTQRFCFFLKGNERGQRGPLASRLIILTEGV